MTLIKSLFFSLLSVVAMASMGQQRVEWLDKNLQSVLDPSKQFYLREVYIESDGNYRVAVKYKTGQIQMTGTYIDEYCEVEDGFFQYFFANGAKESEGWFKGGVKVGEWKRWDWLGEPRQSHFYPDEPLVMLQGRLIPAEFPNGDESLTWYLQNELKYPEEVYNSGISGQVYVSFTVNSDGYIQNPQVVQGLNFYLDAEALRLVSEMPRWKPATKNGLEVNSTFILPVRFEAPAEVQNSQSFNKVSK